MSDVISMVQRCEAADITLFDMHDAYQGVDVWGVGGRGRGEALGGDSEAVALCRCLGFSGTGEGLVAGVKMFHTARFPPGMEEERHASLERR